MQGSAQAPSVVDASKDAAIPSSLSTELQLLIGRRVQQLFGDTYHYGVVDSYDAKVKWFLVKFEDGDQQEYERHELEPLLVKVPVSEPSEDPGAASDDDTPLSALVSK